jgi:hypothetical protein
MLKPMFNVESTKECMSILLFLDLDFHIWEIILVEWENYNILDGSGNVSIHLPTLIEKSTFAYFSNIKEKQLEKLA